MTKIRTAIAGIVFSCMAGAVLAGAPIQQHNSNALWFENWVGLSNATLTVTAPGGQRTQLFVAQGTPVFQLPVRDAPDGIYSYELTAATEKTAKIVNQVDNGRGDAARDTTSIPYNMTGQFTVSRGVIIRPEEIKEGASGQDN